MGEVHLALDTRLDRQVVVKALPAHLAQDPDRLARFECESKVLALLNHPSIAAIDGLDAAGVDGPQGPADAGGHRAGAGGRGRCHPLEGRSRR